jgi:hypothetical protein
VSTPRKPSRRTVGSLTHADFGKTVQVAGYGSGVLWCIQHVAAIGDIPEPWTRLTVKPPQGGSESTRGLPPTTPVLVTPAPPTEGNDTNE